LAIAIGLATNENEVVIANDTNHNRPIELPPLPTPIDGFTLSSIDGNSLFWDI
jgi:hypothetical protein